jgi:putative hydrolase of the HAD superfamily
MTRITLSKPDVLFDVDGVLVHPQLRFRDYLERNHSITPEMTAPFFRGPFLVCVTGHADLGEELGVYLDQWGWPGTASSFIETWLREDSMPDAAMLEFVASLRQRGFTCHVASVQERNRAAYLRETVGLVKLFNETYFSCYLGAAKPDPVFYSKVQQRLAKPANELLLVDDSQACVDAAREAGWQAFHYQGPADMPQLAATMSAFTAAPPGLTSSKRNVLE